jgi:hypothetical protein
LTTGAGSDLQGWVGSARVLDQHLKGWEVR